MQVVSKKKILNALAHCRTLGETDSDRAVEATAFALCVPIETVRQVRDEHQQAAQCAETVQ